MIIGNLFPHCGAVLWVRHRGADGSGHFFISSRLEASSIRSAVDAAMGSLSAKSLEQAGSASILSLPRDLKEGIRKSR